ncbi:MAG: hypothetical protein ACJ797_07745 [Ktedonobacteraceae bacterium]
MTTLEGVTPYPPEFAARSEAERHRRRRRSAADRSVPFLRRALARTPEQESVY